LQHAVEQWTGNVAGGRLERNPILVPVPLVWRLPCPTCSYILRASFLDEQQQQMLQQHMQQQQKQQQHVLVTANLA